MLVGVCTYTVVQRFKHNKSDVPQARSVCLLFVCPSSVILPTSKIDGIVLLQGTRSKINSRYYSDIPCLASSLCLLIICIDAVIVATISQVITATASC